MKKKLIWLSIFLPGLLYLSAWLFGNTPLENIPFTPYTLNDAIGQVATTALVIIGSFAFGIGLINVFRIHLMAVLNRKKNWPYSLVVFFSFSIILFICVFYGWVSPKLKADKLATIQVAESIEVPVSNNFVYLPTAMGSTIMPISNSFYALSVSNNMAILPIENGMVSLPSAEGLTILSATNIWAVAHDTSDNIDPLYFYVNYINLPLVSTIMALLGFYITYAAYRAFKVRSIDGVVMMSVAIIVMVGYDPLGNYLTHWLKGTKFDAMQLPVIAQFLKETMNGSVFRSLNIGIYIATIAITWRIWTGLESQLTESE